MAMFHGGATPCKVCGKYRADLNNALLSGVVGCQCGDAIDADYPYADLELIKCTERGLPAIVDPRAAYATQVLRFGEALESMKRGLCVRRTCWQNLEGMYLRLRYPGCDEGAPTEVYISLEMYGGSHRVPWTTSTADLLAEDWVIVHDATG